MIGRTSMRIKSFGLGDLYGLRLLRFFTRGVVEYPYPLIACALSAQNLTQRESGRGQIFRGILKMVVVAV